MPLLQQTFSSPPCRTLRLGIALCLLATLSACGLPRLHFPGVYKIDIQQGNIITQEMVNQLKPGMNKRQVLFVMGTPMLSDTFHPERWDYIYRVHPGSKPAEQFRVTLYFQDETLAGMDGDLRPMSAQEMAQFQPEERQRSVVVPLKEADDGGLFNRALKTVGLGTE